MGILTTIIIIIVIFTLFNLQFKSTLQLARQRQNTEQRMKTARLHLLPLTHINTTVIGLQSRDRSHETVTLRRSQRRKLETKWGQCWSRYAMLHHLECNCHGYRTSDTQSLRRQHRKRALSGTQEDAAMLPAVWTTHLSSRRPVELQHTSRHSTRIPTSPVHTTTTAATTSTHNDT